MLIRQLRNFTKIPQFGFQTRYLFTEEELRKKIDKLRSFDRVEISRTMTIRIFIGKLLIILVESSLKSDRLKSHQLLKTLIEQSKYSSRLSKVHPIRVGLCGSPGAGKSSLIEKLGLYMCNKGVKVAVLAIDPSSRTTGGSILGDKTRMEWLSQHDNAFVRPSATRGIMGGLALNTNELATLCESKVL